MSDPSPYPIQSQQNALLTGMVFGLATKHGLSVSPEYDENGDYAASAILDLPAGDGVTVRIVVDAPDIEEEP
jgi:hypothetical protein